MAGRPEFTAAQRKRLKYLGVIREQVERLRAVLVAVQSALQREPAQGDVRGVLGDVAKHTRALLAILGPMVSRNDIARAAAIEHMDEAFMDRRREAGQPLRFEEGEVAMRILIPQLQQLHLVADTAFKKMGGHLQPARSRTAHWIGVGVIDGALRDGWEFAHSGESIPEKFKPTANEGSTFREVVGICYEAAGAGVDADPLRAIRAYMRIRGGSAAKRRKNRTHAKT